MLPHDSGPGIALQPAREASQMAAGSTVRNRQLKQWLSSTRSSIKWIKRRTSLSGESSRKENQSTEEWHGPAKPNLLPPQSVWSGQCFIGTCQGTEVCIVDCRRGNIQGRITVIVRGLIPTALVQSDYYQYNAGSGFAGQTDHGALFFGRVEMEQQRRRRHVRCSEALLDYRRLTPSPGK
jgi:hypothetical protein